MPRITVLLKEVKPRNKAIATRAVNLEIRAEACEAASEKRGGLLV